MDKILDKNVHQDWLAEVMCGVKQRTNSKQVLKKFRSYVYKICLSWCCKKIKKFRAKEEKELNINIYLIKYYGKQEIIRKTK